MGLRGFVRIIDGGFRHRIALVVVRVVSGVYVERLCVKPILVRVV